MVAMMDGLWTFGGEEEGWIFCKDADLGIWEAAATDGVNLEEEMRRGLMRSTRISGGQSGRSSRIAANLQNMKVRWAASCPAASGRQAHRPFPPSLSQMSRCPGLKLHDGRKLSLSL